MSDFDTQRIGEVAALEQSIHALQQQVKDLKADADKWTPRVGSSMADGSARVTLHFGGKAMAATVNSTYLAQTDATTATTAIVETLCQSLVIDRLKEVVRPEVEKLIAGINAASKAGKW